MSAPVVHRSPVQVAQVLAAADATPRMRRLRLHAQTMAGVAVSPAQDIELHLVDDTGRRVKRRYTLCDVDTARGEFSLDVAQHGSGPGAHWGATAAPGDTVRFQGPRGKLVLTDADWHLLVGDESALPAIRCIAAAVTAPALAVVEVLDAAEQEPVAAATRWVHRGTQPPGTPQLLLAAVAALELPPGTGHAYLMGETRTMVALRGVLEQRGITHESIFVKGYWNIARPDRVAGRAPRAD